MDASRRRKLEAGGWRVGEPRELLQLSDDEAALVEMRLALADEVRRRRRDAEWTQAELASALGSSQSRVAKMESADRSVSLDLLVRGLLALGASRREVSRALARDPRSAA